MNDELYKHEVIEWQSRHATGAAACVAAAVIFAAILLLAAFL